MGKMGLYGIFGTRDGLYDFRKKAFKGCQTPQGLTYQTPQLLWGAAGAQVVAFNGIGAGLLIAIYEFR